MKSIYISIFFQVMSVEAGAQSGCCGGEGSTPRVFRDAATHDSMTKGVKRIEDPITKFKVVQPLEGSVKPETVKPVGILERSDIIHYGSLVTLVPKRAVLHLPENLRGVRGRVEGKRLVRWQEFYRANRAWIETIEVTRAQAEGWEPLPEKLTMSFENKRKAVVAVLQGGPISVLPYVEPEEPVAETTSTK